jgi:hypothetical protein
VAQEWMNGHTFDSRSPRTSAYRIHEWVNIELGLNEDDLRSIQIDGSRRKMSLKFVTEVKLSAVLREIGGT